MNVITASSPSIAGEIARFGSALSIAFALNMRDKRHNRLNRVVESQSYIQKILEKEGCDLGIDDDMNAAFLLLRSDHENALREIDGIFNEIFALGFVAGTEPATDSQFSGNGLQRPTKQFLDDFFSDADN